MIRPYADGDLEELLDVWYRASRVAHSFLPEEFFETERRLIADEWLPLSETVVFEISGKVVGFLSLVRNEVGGLFVDPDMQRQGIGRRLMDHARESRPYLELGVFEENMSGRRFYEAYGFREVSRSVNEDTGHVELWMRLDPARPAT